VKIKVEEYEEEDQQLYGPSERVTWIKEEHVNYNERLVPSVNESGDHSSVNFKSETSIKIKCEEDTEEDIPLVSKRAVQLRDVY
jgi:hypothetical protein